MAENKGFLQFAKEYRDVLQIVLTLSGILVLIANLYIASLIAPLKSDIARVDAIATQNQDMLVKKEALIDRIEVIIKQLDLLERRIERVEDKL